MLTFQVHDTVALRDDHTFVGSIERTSLFDSEPLDDCLIIAFTEVPSDIIDRFVQSGTPPSDYVFVQFAQQEKGSSLVAEKDLLLLDRIFDVGDVVKQESSQILGTVTDVSCSYVLDPVWLPRSSTDGFAADPAAEAATWTPHTCNQNCDPLQPWTAHMQPQRLLTDVPFEELKRAQDFMEGDYVIAQDWIGVVTEIEMNVVLRLENNTVVVVAEPEDLFIPIPDYKKHFVALPEYDGLIRPDYVSAVQGWSNVIPPEDLECGQFVTTTPRNLKNGRWLRGVYDPKVKPEGRILMVRCRDLNMNWLICNAFTPEHHWETTTPKSAMPYENLGSFLDPRELRRDRTVALYDPSKPATMIADRRRISSQLNQGQTLVKNTTPVNLSSNFSAGERVKFRDAAGAAVKYQGISDGSPIQNRFDRIQHSETFGYDLNEFEIVQSCQTVTVRWQNGSVSKQLSISLSKTNLFEADLMPADVVVAREGMKQRQRAGLDEDPMTVHPLFDFNEMTFFEKPHDLLPAKVGVIQNIESGERLATVRWFQHPSIRITYSGNAIGPESRFGPISDVVEDVSMYEIMSFSALVRKLRDVVTIVPSSISRKAIDAMAEITQDDFLEVSACVTALSQIPDRDPMALLEYMQHNARKSIDELLPGQIIDNYKSHRLLDWVGEIGQLRTDGSLVVRVNFEAQARDLIIEHDQILSFVDEIFWGIDHNEDPMSMDSDSEDFSMTDASGDVLLETVVYEGGSRIDDDAGDENWESDEDEEVHVQLDTFAVADKPASGDLDTFPATGAKLLSNPVPSASTAQLDASARPALATYYSLEEPVSFCSLDQEPPSDQFRASEPASTSSAFLKRISKEHRILASSLPRHEIYVRTYDSRLDLLRCLIVGPIDTPYERAPFLIDLHLGPGFPREPPTAHFHSWTSGLGRVNPNLYEEGKICLSLLGTWPGKSDTESWTEKATILQLLVSLQGLVFVRNPFYNEAGYDGAEGYTNESLQYSEKAYVMARNFVKHALSSPVSGLEDVLAWLYLPKSKHKGQLAALYDDESALLKQIINRGRALIDRSETTRGKGIQLGGGQSSNDDQLLSGDGKSGDATTVFLRPLSKGAFVMLSKTIKALDDILSLEILELAGSVLNATEES